MADAVRCYGPPGTGKTYRGTRWIEHLVREGADPARVAFVSFTNSACDEARRRVCDALDLYDYEMGYCATLHALCKRALSIGGYGEEWLADGKLLREFADQYDYDLIPSARRAASEDMDEVAAAGGQDALLLAIWEFGRQRLIFDAVGAWEAFEAYDPDTLGRVDYRRYLQFVADYEGWKPGGTTGFKRLYDYTDLLREMVEHPAPIPVSVAVVDEAQDMTPLLWAAADALFSGADYRACLGDDDQAIYGYQGAAPELFNARSAERVVQLGQSRRLPRAVWELAQRVIQQNRNRVDKHFEPVTEEILAERSGERAKDGSDLKGFTSRVSGYHRLPLGNGESWMLLVRNWCHSKDVATELEDLGIPYHIAGGKLYSPWSEKGPLRAVKAIYALSNGERITLGELAPLLDKTRAEQKSSETAGAWQYGQKARIKERIDADPGEKVSLMDLPQLGLTEWGFDRIATRDLELLSRDLSPRDLKAYRQAQKRGTWGLDPRQVMISSIHGVKGQEAENVAALATCTYAPARNLDREDRREEEIRLAYVGITRALRRFYVVDQQLGQPYEVWGI